MIIRLESISIDFVLKHDIINYGIVGDDGSHLILTRSWSHNIDVDGPEGFDVDAPSPIGCFNGLEVSHIVFNSDSVEIVRVSGEPIVVMGRIPLSMFSMIRLLCRENGPKIVEERLNH